MDKNILPTMVETAWNSCVVVAERVVEVPQRVLFNCCVFTEYYESELENAKLIFQLSFQLILSLLYSLYSLITALIYLIFSPLLSLIEFTIYLLHAAFSTLVPGGLVTILIGKLPSYDYSSHAPRANFYICKRGLEHNKRHHSKTLLFQLIFQLSFQLILSLLYSLYSLITALIYLIFSPLLSLIEFTIYLLHAAFSTLVPGGLVTILIGLITFWKWYNPTQPHPSPEGPPPPLHFSPPPPPPEPQTPEEELELELEKEREQRLCVVCTVNTKGNAEFFVAICIVRVC
eukprot:sb/3467693/